MNAPNPPQPPSSRQSLSDGSDEEATPPAQFWRSRNVLLLLTARSVSVAGDWLFNIALVWLVLQTTHSARMVAAVSIAQAVPVIAFGVFYAGILDRVRSRRKALVVIDLARAMIVLAYPLLQAGNLLNPVTLIMSSVALGAANAVFNPGLQSLLPDVLATSDLPRAHAMLDVTQRLGRILGPGLSGLLLLLVTTSDFFYIDSGGYLISAVGLAGLAVRVQRSPKAGAARSRAGSRFHDLRASVGYLRSAPVSRRLIIVRTVQNGLWAVYTVGLPLLVYQSFGQTPGVFGVLVGVYAVGQLIGNFLAVQLHGYTHPLRNLHGGWILCGFGYVIVGLSHTPALAGVALAVSGIGSAAANIGNDGYLAVTTNPRIQGRVFTLQSTGMTLAQILGNAAFGTFLDKASPEHGFIFAGTAMTAIVTVSAIRRPVSPPAAQSGH